jgi:thymidylate synthase
MMVAQVVNMKPGTFIHDYGDLHIYGNHLDQVVEQLSKPPFPYPTMEIVKRGQAIDGFMPEDFQLNNYQSHKYIKADVAV